jgi:transcriptional regulator with XRE-family HTH domain
MPAEARADVERRVRESLREMPFHELRAARRLTQEQLAETLGLTQGAVSQVEHQTDLYLSTLRKFVEAMGGQLEICAQFPDGRVRLTEIGEGRPAVAADAR